MFQGIIDEYLKLHPAERSDLKPLLDQLTDKEDLTDRKNFRGHYVAAAVIFSPDLKKILMVYHPTFKRWQQPGGHIDPTGETPLESAKREAIEETGVRLGRQIHAGDPDLPIFLETHDIPASPGKDEPVHRHHNFWYGFVAKDLGVATEDDVIEQVEWKAPSAISFQHFAEAVKRLQVLLELKA